MLYYLYHTIFIYSFFIFKIVINFLFFFFILQKAKQATAAATEEAKRKAQLAEKLQEASEASSSTVTSKETQKKYAHALRMTPEGTQTNDEFSLTIDFDQVPVTVQETGELVIYYYYFLKFNYFYAYLLYL